jgi:hypothetical protein
MDDQRNRANDPRIAIADNRFTPRGSIFANHPAIADVVAQSNIHRTPSPDRAGAGIAADFHGLRPQIHRDGFPLAITDFEPDATERHLDNGHHQTDAESEQRSPGKSTEPLCGIRPDEEANRPEQATRQTGNRRLLSIEVRDEVADPQTEQTAEENPANQESETPHTYRKEDWEQRLTDRTGYEPGQHDSTNQRDERNATACEEGTTEIPVLPNEQSETQPDSKKRRPDADDDDLDPGKRRPKHFHLEIGRAMHLWRIGWCGNNLDVFFLPGYRRVAGFEFDRALILSRLDACSRRGDTFR